MKTSLSWQEKKGGKEKITLKCISSFLKSSPLKICSPPLPPLINPSTLLNCRSQELFGLGHDLILVGVQTVELNLQPINRVDNGHRDHAGEVPRSQLEAAGAGQLDRQDAKEEGGELLSQTGPDAPTKRQIVETSFFVFTPLLTEAVRVKGIHIFEDSSSVMGVPNAVHHTPAFGNLDSLETKDRDP